MLAHLSQQGLLCFGPREGRQQTFVLLEDWIPRSPETSVSDPDRRAATKAAERYGRFLGKKVATKITTG